MVSSRKDVDAVDPLAYRSYMSKKPPEPTVSVKIRKSTLRELRAWCEPRGIKLLWAFDQAVNGWVGNAAMQKRP